MTPLGLRETLDRASGGSRLIFVVPGSGLIVECAVASNADVLMVLNAGAYRSLGTGSLASFLAYENANDQTRTLLREQVLPRAQGLPVVAGVFAADPTRPIADRLAELKDLGAQGVVNWPAIGFIDGSLRQELESEGIGTEAEARMLTLAREMGLVTFGFALAVDEVEKFLAAEVDGLILDVGLTRVSGDVRLKRDELHQAISTLNQLAEAAASRPECVKIAYGGPITTPEDLREVFRNSSIQGFAGGSVFERLPVSDIVGTTLRRFKGVALSQERSAADSFGGIVGSSPRMRHVFDMIRRVASQDVTVCIEGASGTGKELVASQIHRSSSRANHPFVTLNCGAIPETLLESELFGHERGAFTSAERMRKGKFELARGGTLLLDEIADLSPRGQVALLRVLQQREVSRVGGDTTIPVDVRVLTASNRALSELVEAGEFRADLYFRLNAVTIRLPPLCERREDIPLLVEAFLPDLRARLNRDVQGLSAKFERKLWSHSWPGNVRELEHVINRCAILEDGAVLEGWAFDPVTIRTPEPTPLAGRSPTNRERAERALWEAHGNKSRAAEILQVTRKTLYRWLSENS